MALTQSTLFELCNLSLFHCSRGLKYTTFLVGIHFGCQAKEEIF